MKKFIKTSILGLVLSLTTMNGSGFAAPVKNNQIPNEVQNDLLNPGQPELNEFSTREQYPDNNHLIVPPTSKELSGEVSIQSVVIGTSDSDNTESANISDAWNVISAETYSTGSWEDIIYFTWKGYGYTGYNGSTKPDKAQAKVKVRASGLVPSISAGGVSWAPLTTSKQIASAESSSSYPYYAKANFSNVKITVPGTFIIIFDNESIISVPGIGNDTWSEDIWFWT